MALEDDIKAAAKSGAAEGSKEILAALETKVDDLTTQVSKLAAAVAAGGGSQPSNPGTGSGDTGGGSTGGTQPQALPFSTPVLAADGKSITVAYNELIAVGKVVVQLVNTVSYNVISVAPDSAKKNMVVGLDQTIGNTAQVIGKAADFRARSTGSSGGSTGGSTTTPVGGGDAPTTVGYPASDVKVGTASVAVFTNENWTNGVWATLGANGVARPGVAMPSNQLLVAGAVILFSDGTRSTIQEVQVGDKNSSVWLDKAPDSAKIAANNLVTIISSPYKAPATGSGSTVGSFKVAARGALFQPGMENLVWGNFGQAGGGSVIPGVNGTHYGWGSKAAMTRAKTDGLQGLRVSCLAERFVPKIGGPLSQTYLDELIAQLEMAYDILGPRSVQLCAAHNYAGRSLGNDAGQRVQLGTAQVPQGTFAYGLYNLLIPAVMKSEKAWKAIYGWDWMNEPINLASPQIIFTEYQQCTDVLRKYDPTGETWTIFETYPWGTTVNGADTIPMLAKINDPANKKRVNIHCYFDPDHGGDYVEADSLVSLDVSFMDKALAAAKAAGIAVDFGEIGAPAAVWQNGAAVATPRALEALHNGVKKALTNGSRVMAWWYNPDFQPNNWDNVNSLTAPRNAPALGVFQQFVPA